jgi:hypothetical protein
LAEQGSLYFFGWLPARVDHDWDQQEQNEGFARYGLFAGCLPKQLLQLSQSQKVQDIMLAGAACGQQLFLLFTSSCCKPMFHVGPHLQRCCKD